MPKCLVKADDFYASSSSRWRAFLELCEDERLPVSLGFIGKHLHQGREPDKKLVRMARHPRNEVWNHGLNHWRQEETGRAEFLGEPIGNQIDSIGMCQELAEATFSVRPRCFGPPFNSYDVNTLKAISRFDEMDLAFDFACHPSLSTIPKHYYVSCDVADSGRRFNPDRAVRQGTSFMLRRSPFVIQIHPGNHWTAECLQSFRVFIRFVRASGYRFVLSHRLLT